MTDKKFTPAQMEIVSGIVQTYDVDPNEITFFSDDAEPFLGYEAGCVMLNRLMPDLADIDIEPLPPLVPGGINLKVRLTDGNGHTRSGLGIVHPSDEAQNNQLSMQQLQYLAQSRGLRSALRAAGIDLMRLHRSRANVAEFSGPSSTNRAHLTRQLHALASEVGFIIGDDRQNYHRFMMHRYGVGSSSQMSEEVLADAVAALQAIRPPSIAKAA